MAGFNPGSVNTGWLNTGDTNTGVANSGDVNTGAFISGNHSNGALWRGDYQGLLGFSYRPAVLPQTPFLDLTLTGGLGSVVIPAIDIPAIRPEFSANVAIDSFTVPSIPIPQIDLAATTVSVGLGPITVPHLDIPRVPVTLNYLFGSQPGGPLKIGPITGLFNTPIGLTPLALSQIVIGASSSQGAITAFLANLPFSTPVVTIDEIPLLASVTGHSEPIDIFPGGLTIPAMNPLSINLSGGTGAFTIPAITIGEIPFDLVAHSTLGPVHILIDLPAVPGFGNTTGAPSSGFFNSGAGGVSGKPETLSHNDVRLLRTQTHPRKCQKSPISCRNGRFCVCSRPLTGPDMRAALFDEAGDQLSDAPRSLEHRNVTDAVEHGEPVARRQ